MTLEDHNRILGILHLVYGGIHGLMLVLIFLIFGAALIPLSLAPSRDAPPVIFFLLVFGFVLLISLFLLIPPLVAGYGLLKRKAWARTAGIVSAILATLSFPFGTALAVYAFWFLFGAGARLYAGGGQASSRYTLSDAPPRPTADWFEQGREREREHAPPSSQPPDWRDG